MKHEDFTEEQLNKKMKEIKDKAWTALFFGKESVTSIEEIQKILSKMHEKQEVADKKDAVRRIDVNKKYKKEDLKQLKIMEDKFYIAHLGLTLLQRVKKWYYGENKFNILLLEKRDSKNEKTRQI